MKRAMLGSLAAATAFAQQSALDAAGPNAYRIKLLGAFFLVLLSLIFLIVIALALIPLARRHRGIEQEPLEQRHQPSQSTERKLAGSVGAATVITVLILFGLVIISVMAGKTVSGP